MTTEPIDMENHKPPNMESNSVDPDYKQKRIRTRLKLVAVGAAVLGMIIGSVVDRFVQNLLDKTGMFGPTLEQVVNDQIDNFQVIKAKLAELSKNENLVKREQLVEELNTLLAKQEQLAGRTHEELRDSGQKIETLKEEALRTKGIAAGADFYLNPGQSITVGGRDKVFSLLRVQKGGRAYVNLSGELQWLQPGDLIEIPVADNIYKIFNKGVSNEDQSRVGFDLVRSKN
jgi:hypothetical protein